MTDPKRPSTICFNAGFNSILEIYGSNNSHFLSREKILEGEVVSFPPVMECVDRESGTGCRLEFV